MKNRIELYDRAKVDGEENIRPAMLEELKELSEECANIIERAERGEYDISMHSLRADIMRLWAEMADVWITTEQNMMLGDYREDGYTEAFKAYVELSLDRLRGHIENGTLGEGL